MREIALNVAKHTPGVIAFYYRFSSDLKTPSDGFFMTRPEGRQGLSDHLSIWTCLPREIQNIFCNMIILLRLYSQLLYGSIPTIKLH